MRFAICDDDFRFLRDFVARVQAYCAEKAIPCECSVFLTPSELFLAGPDCFNILFLNVDMGFWDGINVAGAIRRQGTGALIIFVSSYVQFAPQGYGVGAFRYLLKDELDHSFAAAMDDAMARLPAGEETLTVHMSKEAYHLPLKDIRYVESKKRIVTFYMVDGGTISCYKKLSDLADELADKGFLRVHKSFLVNLRHVADIRNYTVFLDDRTTLQASRQNYRQTAARYREWRQLAEETL